MAEQTSTIINDKLNAKNNSERGLKSYKHYLTAYWDSTQMLENITKMNPQTLRKKLNKMSDGGLKTQQTWMLQTRGIKTHPKDGFPASYHLHFQLWLPVQKGGGPYVVGHMVSLVLVLVPSPTTLRPIPGLVQYVT